MLVDGLRGDLQLWIIEVFQLEPAGNLFRREIFSDPGYYRFREFGIISLGQGLERSLRVFETLSAYRERYTPRSWFLSISRYMLELCFPEIRATRAASSSLSSKTCSASRSSQVKW